MERNLIENIIFFLFNNYKQILYFTIFKTLFSIIKLLNQLYSNDNFLKFYKGFNHKNNVKFNHNECEEINSKNNFDVIYPHNFKKSNYKINIMIENKK